ncbi:RHS repeat-associated core domain-containing protein [Aquimarina longa]|uniref:RHS repeat-associated core domain-containing protein n=1 Tax=Aquimarina longa TaxID=1080221 RepID=UPI000785B4B9|nr:RHS repeat-associated core domain-containing protein [Aquimarina longa]
MNPEGYAEPENDGSFTFVYQFKDYLKNVRLAYADSDKDGKIDVVRNGTDIDGDNDNHHEIKQVRDYYPYGLSWKYGATHPNSLITGSKHNYGYNGKEYTEDLGLNLYEMDVRKYDPAIARWSSIDPIMHGTLSPYTAFDNNPVFWNDPSGASVIIKDGGDSVTFTGQDAIDAFNMLTGGNSEGSEDEESNEGDGEQGKGECCDGIKKFFSDVLSKAYGKTLADTDLKGEIWFGEDGFAYLVRGDNEFYRIYYDSYEQVDELPPMSQHIDIAAPVKAASQSLAMMGAKASKNTMVYWAMRNGKIIYVGITNSFARRSAQHLSKKGIKIKEIDKSLKNLSRDDARAVEQVLIEFFDLGGKKGQTGQLLNRINSIAEKNKKYTEALKKRERIVRISRTFILNKSN